MKKLNMVLCGLLGGCAFAAMPNAEGMFPFVPSYTAPTNVVNMSHLLDAPAGAHGRIRVKDGHFVNDRGRVRLHATNLTGPSNFPTHAEAERLAARLARFGINCVRLHYFDSSYGTFMLPKEKGIIDESAGTRRKLDAERRDRQDYLVAQFKRRGIYVDMNLHVARTLATADGVAPGTPWANKGVDQFDPHIIELEREYARELLTHVNPYTGMSYLKDPVVAIVELNNEDALWDVYSGGGIDRLPDPHAATIRGLWNDWLRAKYGTTEKMLAAWKLAAVPFGPECVTEGAFEAPVAIDGKTWTLDRGEADFAVRAESGALRVTVKKAGGECFPKIYRRVAVKEGTPYTVSFRIRRVSGEAGEVGFAVAERADTWNSLGVLSRLRPTGKWTKKSFAFVAPKTLDTAEIQFTRFKPGVYEIDDLSFRSGNDAPNLLDGTIEARTLPIVKHGAGTPIPQARRDFTQFLCDTERTYWTGMQKYLQQDLGLEAPVSATQLGYSPPQMQADLDFVDNHAYWCHPSINKNWAIGNHAMVNAFGGCITSQANQRVADKPYTISEYNHPYPNFYGAEGQLFLRAYGAFQDWDGVFEYSYNNRQNAEPDHNEYFFSMAARTDVLAHFPACAAMFLRGDVQKAKTFLSGNLDWPYYFDRLARTGRVGQGVAQSREKIPGTMALVHGVNVNLKGGAKNAAIPEAPKGIAVSDTRELTWDVTQHGAGFWKLTAPNVKAFTGFVRGRTFDLGDGVSLAIGKTKLDWATISLVSHDATGFGTRGGARILLTATGLCHNGGAKFSDVGNGRIASRGADWGNGKTICEGINAKVTIPAASSRVRAWALDERGERKTPLAVIAKDNGSGILIGPQYKTVWYEVEVR